jgi:cytidylate kinase
MLITVDGQSSTGKSSLAAALAKRLGFHFLGSGSLYRLVAYADINLQVDLSVFILDLDKRLSYRYHNSEMRVYLGTEDMTAKINQADVTQHASDIAKDPVIREMLKPVQYKFASQKGLVAEGRDMGTIIFPQAELKIFLTADIAVRAERRQKQLRELGIVKPVSEITKQLVIRDSQDESRQIAPLVPANDAIMIDSSLPWGEILDQMHNLALRYLNK